MREKLKSEIAATNNPDVIAYSMLWEDSEVLVKALEINKNDNVISVASSGCNVLALLLQEPKSITAIDLNPAQIHFFKLKIKGIENLSHKEFLDLFGFADNTKALDSYKKIRKKIDQETREYFDKNVGIIEKGLCHSGKLEKYFQGFYREVVVPTKKAELLEEMIECSSLADQIKLIPDLLTEEFERRFLIYTGVERQADKGRDIEKYKHVRNKETIAQRLLDNFKMSLKRVLLKENFYSQYFLLSKHYDVQNTYSYLREDNFLKLKELVHKVVVVNAQVEQHLTTKDKGFYTKGNFSDIFEYMSEDLSLKTFDYLSEYFAKGGRMAYWNLYVDRSSDNKIPKLKYLKELSEKLKEKDRVWFYKNFKIEEVL